jgi:hypothetical protein
MGLFAWNTTFIARGTSPSVITITRRGNEIVNTVDTIFREHRVTEQSNHWVSGINIRWINAVIRNFFLFDVSGSTAPNVFRGATLRTNGSRIIGFQGSSISLVNRRSRRGSFKTSVALAKKRGSKGVSLIHVKRHACTNVSIQTSSKPLIKKLDPSHVI